MNTTGEILDHISNEADQMAGSLNMHGRGEFAAQHLGAIESHLTELRARFATAYELLEAVLPRLGHPDKCVKVRPAEEWLEHGSMDFSGCSCVVARINAALSARATESGEVTRG